MKILSIFMLLTLSLYANQDSEGYMIVKKIDSYNEGMEGSDSQMELNIKDAHGNSTTKELNAKSIELKDGAKTVLEFFKPVDVKGTKLLTWSKDSGDNQIWLYLPRFKRVKQINGQGQSGSFMGSEFTYEDIAGISIDKYTYKLLSEDKKNWVIRATPIKNSGYGQIDLTYHKEKMTMITATYYNLRMEKLKVSDFFDIKPVEHGGKTYHLAQKITMKNLQNGRSSTMTWSNRRIGLKHPQGLFTPQRLK